ncbi:MAG TPA: copper chaperone PCu(A)C [Acetobacteraceae bacterium]
MFPVTRRSVLGFALCATTVLLSPGPLSAHEVTAGALTIQHPWARATAATAKAGALYLTVRNNGAEADRLTGVTTDAADNCEIHLSETSNGVMTMQMVDSVEVPAGGTAAFAPQGAHIMLMGLKAPLKKGAHFPATLHFEKAGDVAVDVLVQGIADLAPAE